MDLSNLEIKIVELRYRFDSWSDKIVIVEKLLKEFYEDSDIILSYNNDFILNVDYIKETENSYLLITEEILSDKKEIQYYDIIEIPKQYVYLIRKIGEKTNDNIGNN